MTMHNDPTTRAYKTIMIASHLSVQAEELGISTEEIEESGSHIRLFQLDCGIQENEERVIEGITQSQAIEFTSRACRRFLDQAAKHGCKL